MSQTPKLPPIPEELVTSPVITNSAGVTARYVRATPELVSVWLAEHNNINRKKRQGQVDQIAFDILNDLWEDNGDTFVFDHEAQMVNGQHRSYAIQESGRAQEILVVCGVKPTVRPTTDTNIKRRFSDDLYMNGELNTIMKEGVARLLIKWDRNGGLADTSWSATRRLLSARYNHYSAEIDRTIENCRRWYDIWPGNKVALLVTFWLLRERLQYDEKIVNRFFSILTIGSQEPDDQMLVRMTQKIGKPVAISANGRVQHMPSGIEVYWLGQAWNRWITGSHVRYTQPHEGISDPYPEFVNPEGMEAVK